MTTPDAPAMLGYAAPAEPSAVVASMRRLLGWIALGYAAAGLQSAAVTILLQMGLLRTSIQFGTMPGQLFQWATHVASLIAVFIGGIEVLRRGGRGLATLRWAAGLAVLLNVAFSTSFRLAGSSLGVNLDKPGDALFQASSLIYSALTSVPLALCLMTLPLRAGRPHG